MSCPKCKFYNSNKAVECGRCGAELPKVQEKKSFGLKFLKKDNNQIETPNAAKSKNFNDIAKALEKHVKREIELTKSEIRIKGILNPFENNSKINNQIVKEEIPESIKLSPKESNMLKNINILDEQETKEEIETEIEQEIAPETKIELELKLEQPAEEITTQNLEIKDEEIKTEEDSLLSMLDFGAQRSTKNDGLSSLAEKTETIKQENNSLVSLLESKENITSEPAEVDDLLSQLNLGTPEPKPLNELNHNEPKLDQAFDDLLSSLESPRQSITEEVDDLLSELNLNTTEENSNSQENQNISIEDGNLDSLINRTLKESETADNLLNELNLSTTEPAIEEKETNHIKSDSETEEANDLLSALNLNTTEETSNSQEEQNADRNLDSLISQTLRELETADNLLNGLNLNTTEPAIEEKVNDIVENIDKIDNDISNLIAATNDIQLIKPTREKSDIEKLYEQELGRELEDGELEMLLGIEEKMASSSSLDALIASTTGIETINLEQEPEQAVENSNDCYVLNDEDTDLDSLLKELEDGLEKN